MGQFNYVFLIMLLRLVGVSLISTTIYNEIFPPEISCLIIPNIVIILINSC